MTVKQAIEKYSSCAKYVQLYIDNWYSPCFLSAQPDYVGDWYPQEITFRCTGVARKWSEYPKFNTLIIFADFEY